jgi:DNA-binding GntR family transcriptional regulator
MTFTLEKLERYLLDHAADFPADSLLLREVAYKRLYDAFRAVELEPGEPVSAVWLSKILGISRTPVREALQQLAADGLIQMFQGRTVAVAARSPQEVFDALQVRELLEPACIRLCATDMAADDLARLRTLTEDMEAAARRGDRAAWSALDIEWHEVLCEACPNKLLWHMVMQARNRMYHRGSDEHVTADYLIDGTVEHRRVLDAIIAQDAAQADQLMLDHLHQLRDNLFRRFIR